MLEKNLETRKYYKPTFEKIPQIKRDRILNCAIYEFSSKGFSAASINTIARKASISIGSMYSYFDSKEALFMTILDNGYKLLQEALWEVTQYEGDIFEKLRKMIRISIDYAKKYHQINQIYIDISSESLRHLANETSLKMENITASLYKKYIEQAKTEGVIRKDIDTNIVSFCIDNIVMMTQFSFASVYYHERMKIYAGDEIMENEERLINQTLDFIKTGIAK